MKKVRNILMLLALIGVATVAVGCTNSGSNSWTTDMGTYDGASLYSVGDFTYNISDVDKIEVDWILGSVKVTERSEATLSVSENGANTLPDDQKLRWRLDGRTLKIKFWKSGYSTTDDVSTQKDLVLEVPAGIVLDIETVSAPIRAQNNLNMREVDFETVSGSIECLDVIATAGAEFETTSGKIELGDVTASEIDVQTTSGNMVFNAKRATEVEIETTSGNSEIVIGEVPSVEIESVSGKVGVTISDGANVIFGTVSGKLRTSKEYTKNGKNYVFGNGACRIEVETTSGDLEIQ